MRLEDETPKKQRALVLGGGGSLGAYQAGVLKVLCQKIMEKDKEKGKHDLLFDVVAGTFYRCHEWCSFGKSILANKKLGICNKKASGILDR